MDWEAQDDGFVAKILAEEGAKDIAVGSPVIVIVEDQVLIPLPPFPPTLQT
jgi:pyruvate dehydrogenase E2 component (dihydrolipoamide acetyltransferase)